MMKIVHREPELTRALMADITQFGTNLFAGGS